MAISGSTVNSRRASVHRKIDAGQMTGHTGGNGRFRWNMGARGAIFRMRLDSILPTDDLTGLIDRRRNVLQFYSPYSFLRGGDQEALYTATVKEPLLGTARQGGKQLITIEIAGVPHYFIAKNLDWDSQYFGVRTSQLLAVLYDHGDYIKLREAVALFARSFFANNGCHCFAEIPSEDTLLIKALNAGGFRLIETRVTYYMNKLADFRAERHGVRQATVADTNNLKRVAREMRNPFDRFHSDEVYNSRQADEFLATYIEESLKGFADFVMVPDEEGVRPDAFLTANYFKKYWEGIGRKVSKMVLSAVSSETCKGWYRKLISEMTFHLREVGAETIFMHPAITNRAVIHVLEGLGYRFGRATHILSRHE